MLEMTSDTPTSSDGSVQPSNCPHGPVPLHLWQFLQAVMEDRPELEPGSAKMSQGDALRDEAKPSAALHPMQVSSRPSECAAGLEKHRQGL